jgi:hypothetical protein
LRSSGNPWRRRRKPGGPLDSAWRKLGRSIGRRGGADGRQEVSPRRPPTRKFGPRILDFGPGASNLQP